MIKFKQNDFPLENSIQRIRVIFVIGASPDMIRHSLAIFLAFLLLACIAPGGHAENLMDIYRQTVASSPVLARSQALLEAQRAGTPLARAELLPNLDIAAGISRNQVDITGYEPLQTDQTYTGNFYSVTLTQPLFNGPAYIAQDVAEAQTRVGEAALLATGQQLLLQVAEAYFAVLQAQADVQVAENEKALLLQILDQAETFRQVGTGDIIAVHEARARADAADAGLIRAENLRRIARQRLQRLTHQSFGELDDLGLVEPEGPRPDQIEPWVQAAFDQQPELLRARMELQAAEGRVQIARRSRWPRVNLDTGYSHVKGAILPDMERDELTAGLSVRFPLYQGGAVAAKTEQARSLAQASRYNLEDLRDQVRLETETAFFNLQSSVADLNAASQALTSARISLDATREGYRVGVRSIIELLTVIQDFATIQRNYFTALYDHVTGRVRLKAAAGVLAVEDLEAINSLLLPGGETPDFSERNG